MAIALFPKDISGFKTRLLVGAFAMTLSLPAAAAEKLEASATLECLPRTADGPHAHFVTTQLRASHPCTVVVVAFEPKGARLLQGWAPRVVELEAQHNLRVPGFDEELWVLPDLEKGIGEVYVAVFGPGSDQAERFRNLVRKVAGQQDPNGMDAHLLTQRLRSLLDDRLVAENQARLPRGGQGPSPLAGVSRDATTETAPSLKQNRLFTSPLDGWSVVIFDLDEFR